MEGYDVYLYDLPKIEDNKVLVTKESQTRQFSTADEAKGFVAENRTRWDRIVLVQTSGNVQKAIERFRDGKIEPLPSPPEEQGRVGTST